MTKIKPIKDQVIVITGASSGFGKGVALKFAEEGASVVLAARRDKLLHELAEACEAKGAKALAIPTDVSNAQDVENLARLTIASFGRIDTWINNAGVGALGKFEDIPLKDHEQVIKTNLFGALYGSYAAYQQFLKQGNGILINIASVLGKIPTPYYSSYTASKFGIVGLNDSLRLEIREQEHKDIYVCTVMPMAMDTPFFEHSANYTGRIAEPIPPVYDAEKVVDTIFDLVTDPKDDVIVGAAGKVSNVMHHILPETVEAMMSKNTQKTQMEKAPKAANTTSGSVHEPEESGSGVHGKIRAKK